MRSNEDFWKKIVSLIVPTSGTPDSMIDKLLMSAFLQGRFGVDDTIYFVSDTNVHNDKINSDFIGVSDWGGRGFTDYNKITLASAMYKVSTKLVEAGHGQKLAITIELEHEQCNQYIHGVNLPVSEQIMIGDDETCVILEYWDDGEYGENTLLQIDDMIEARKCLRYLDKAREEEITISWAHLQSHPNQHYHSYDIKIIPKIANFGQLNSKVTIQ